MAVTPRTIFFDENSQCWIDEAKNVYSYDGTEWTPRINWRANERFDGTPVVTVAESDAVRHPAHYAEGRTIETWNAIADWRLDYFTGNAVKYLSRAGRKSNEIEDLKKAIAYIEKRIKILESK